MSEDSRKTEKLDKVDLTIAEYEWTCPHCGRLNTEPNFGVNIGTVNCIDCYDCFRVSDNTWE